MSNTAAAGKAGKKVLRGKVGSVPAMPKGGRKTLQATPNPSGGNSGRTINAHARAGMVGKSSGRKVLVHKAAKTLAERLVQASLRSNRANPKKVSASRIRGAGGQPVMPTTNTVSLGSGRGYRAKSKPATVVRVKGGKRPSSPVSAAPKRSTEAVRVTGGSKSNGMPVPQPGARAGTYNVGSPIPRNPASAKPVASGRPTPASKGKELVPYKAPPPPAARPVGGGASGPRYNTGPLLYGGGGMPGLKAPKVGGGGGTLPPPNPAQRAGSAKPGSIVFGNKSVTVAKPAAKKKGLTRNQKYGLYGGLAAGGLGLGAGGYYMGKD